MKRFLAAVAVLATAAVWVSVAMAEQINSSSLDCSGLTLNYQDFPTTPIVITDSWQYSGDGKTFTTTVSTSGTSGTVVDPLPELPVPGTRVLVGFKFDSNGTTLQGAEWTNLTCAAAPPPAPPPPVTPPPVPPTSTTPSPPPPPASTPTTTPTPPPCGKIKRERIRARIRPQYLRRGIAVLKVSAPPSVKRIRVTIYDDYAKVAWTKTYKRRYLALRLNVQDASVWGVWSQCDCTYGNHRIVVRFFTACTSARRILVYKNQDYRKVVVR